MTAAPEETNENPNIRELKQSDDVVKSGLIKSGVYYTNNHLVKITLNHDAIADIVFTADENNKWQNNIKMLWDQAEVYSIGKEHKSTFYRFLNDNQDIITPDKNSYDNNNGGENVKSSQADVLIELFNKSSPILFKDEFNVPHALVNIDGHYEV
jgi:hypothetical protein